MAKRATQTRVVGKAEQRPATESVEEAIRRRAYELYLERGGAPGRDVDDWLQAEQELPPHQASGTRAKRKK